MAKRARPPVLPEVEPSGLSPQQKRIWELARDGKTVPDSAQILGVSADTIRQQIKRIRQKGFLPGNSSKNNGNKSVYARSTQSISVLKSGLVCRSAAACPSASGPAGDAEVGPDLTAREFEVALLRRTGHRNADVAGVLGIAPGTVRVLQFKARRRASRAEKNGLVKYALTEEGRRTLEKLQATNPSQVMVERSRVENGRLLEALRTYLDADSVLSREERAGLEMALRTAGLLRYAPILRANNVCSSRILAAGARSLVVVLRNDQAKAMARELAYHKSRLRLLGIDCVENRMDGAEETGKAKSRSKMYVYACDAIAYASIRESWQAAIVERFDMGPDGEENGSPETARSLE